MASELGGKMAIGNRIQVLNSWKALKIEALVRGSSTPTWSPSTLPEPGKTDRKEPKSSAHQKRACTLITFGEYQIDDIDCQFLFQGKKTLFKRLFRRSSKIRIINLKPKKVKWIWVEILNHFPGSKVFRVSNWESQILEGFSLTEKLEG